MTNTQNLKDLLEEIKVKSENVVNSAGEVQKTGSFIKEFTEVSLENFDNSPLADDPAKYVRSFKPILDNLNIADKHMRTMTSTASGIAFGTASAMATLSGVLTYYNYTPRTNPSYVQFYSQLDEVIDRGQTRDQATTGIKKLGLDTTKEGQDAIKLLESAWEVHLQGVGMSTSSLIPLRESIAKTLQAIQKKGIIQSRVKDWILDLVSEVAFSNINQTELNDLQNEHNTVRDKLSGSKNKIYSKDEERTYLREGTLHLIKIINIVDLNKLK